MTWPGTSGPCMRYAVERWVTPPGLRVVIDRLPGGAGPAWRAAVHRQVGQGVQIMEKGLSKIRQRGQEPADGCRSQNQGPQPERVNADGNTGLPGRDNSPDQIQPIYMIEICVVRLRFP